jgi:hypothetical protein
MVQLVFSDHLKKQFCAAKGSDKLSKDLRSHIADICGDDKRKSVEYDIVLQYWREASKAGMLFLHAPGHLLATKSHFALN